MIARRFPLFVIFFSVAAVGLSAQNPKSPAQGTDYSDFAPSYTVHIVPSQAKSLVQLSGENLWSVKGFDLKNIISLLYGVNPIRIELPAALDTDQRYDISLLLPSPEGRQQIEQRVRQGIEDYFHIAATRESRSMQVYVVTAPGDKKPPTLNAQTEAGGESFSSFVGFDSAAEAVQERSSSAGGRKAFSLDDVNSIMVEGTADQFCQTLEHSLDLPVVNETNLQGKFAFHIEANQTSKNDFLDRLDDQLGLVIEPAQRSIEILVFKSR